jgi:hypothetical protein
MSQLPPIVAPLDINKGIIDSLWSVRKSNSAF